MVDIASLWLPIVLSSVVVFILSAIIHMAPLWHKNDFPRMKDETKIMDALRPFGMTPGLYVMPRAENSTDMRSPEFAEKMKKGPVVMMTVLPNGTVSMGKSLTLWFLYVLVVGIICAYVTGRALPAGASYLHVFRFAGTTAFLSYAAAVWQGTIWFGRPWSLSLKDTFDGLLFALFTAGVFGWLWVR